MPWPARILVCLTLVAPPALAVPVPPFVSAFSAAFETADFLALRDVAPALNRYDGEWREVAEILEAYDCLSAAVMGHEVERITEGEAAIWVDLDLTGTHRWRHQTEKLLRAWRLELKLTSGRWVLTQARSAEGYYAFLLVTAPEGHTEDLIATASRLNRRTVAEQLLASAVWLPAEFARHLRTARRLMPPKTNERFDAYALRMEATAARNLSDFPAAIRLAAESEALARASGDDSAASAALMTRGLAVWMAGDADGAMALLDESIAALDRIDDPRVALKALHMSGHLSSIRGQMQQAVTRAQRLERESLRFGWYEGYANASFILASVQRELRNYSAAIAHARESVRRSIVLGDGTRSGMGTFNQANAHAELGDLETAGRMLEELIAAGVYASDHVTLALARVRLAQGATDTARAVIARISPTQKRDPGFNRLLLTTMSEIELAAGNAGEAERLANAAIATAAPTSLEVPPQLWRPLVSLARAERQLGRGEAASDHYRAAIEALERQSGSPDTTSGSDFLADQASSYRELVELLIDTGKPEEALRVSERMRGWTVQQIARRGEVTPDAGAESTRMDQLNTELAMLNRSLLDPADPATVPEIRARISRVREELDRTVADSAVLHPHLRRRQSPVPQKTPLAEGELALSFILGRDRSFVLLVDQRGAVEVRHLRPGRAELRTRITALLASAERRELDSPRLAAALAVDLLEPLLPRIRTARRIYIIPDDVLWQLPFAMLPTGQKSVLLDTTEIVYSPSLAALAEPARPHRDRTLLAVAYGAPTSTTIALPEVEREVRQIAASYQNGNVLAGADANESVVKSQSAGRSILHFATHATIDDGAPLFSSLSLAPDGTDDGLLEAREILDLQLNAELAILSGCETARGVIGAGEGVIGLSWAFRVGGVDATVVTDWKLDSASAAQLMPAFHRALARGASAPAALRSAQLALRKQPRYRHPYYWAAFRIVGRTAADATPQNAGFTGFAAHR